MVEHLLVKHLVVEHLLTVHPPVKHLNLINEQLHTALLLIVNLIVKQNTLLHTYTLSTFHTA